MPAALQKDRGCAIIKPRNGAVRCPTCMGLLLRVRPESQARDLPLYCRRCRRTWTLNIDHQERPESPS